MSAGPRAARHLPGRAVVSSWGLWRRKHREGGTRCSKGQDGVRVCPRVPPLGCMPRDPFPGPGDPCVQRRVGGNWALPARDWAGSPQPCAGFIAGGRAGAPAAQRGALGSAPRGAPGTVGTRGGWEREQRTRGRVERRGAPWQRDTNARTGASGAETRTSERWGDRAGGTRQGGPCPARAFVHGRRSAAPAPPGAEVLQSN